MYNTVKKLNELDIQIHGNKNAFYNLLNNLKNYEN